ncbi:phage portal protein [Zavarzinia sp.]|uniref:phage portal protein n=1 Tax=Zavarzinia sp. TaxID=2027920 RepID=UPI003566AC06
MSTPTSEALDQSLAQRTGATVRILKHRAEPGLYSTAPTAPVKKARKDAPREGSKALSSDPWQGIETKIVMPPHDPATLAGLIELSPDLAAAIDAMVTNVDGFGYVLQPLVNLTDNKAESDAIKAAMAAEHADLQNFLDVAGDTDDVTALRKKIRTDRESIGYALVEVIRDTKGRILHLQHLPSREMRLGREDPDHTRVTVKQLRRKPDGTWEYVDRYAYRRLRQYVQAKLIDGARVRYSGLHDDTPTQADSGDTAQAVPTLSPWRVWFRSFGDPRVIDKRTGDVVPADKAANFDGKGNPMPDEFKANEVLYFRRYSSRSPYGIVRWISALLHVLGNRSAQEINYTTLTNNNIPSMVITASKGRLTEGSISRVKQFTETHIQGTQNFSTFLILEGESGLESDESAQTVIEVKPLTANQHTDALFVNYTEFTGSEIRKTFRIPSLFLGGMKEINRAAAEEVRRLTDEQVFAPERDEFDREFNSTVLADLGFQFWRYVSRTPNVTDNKDLVAMLASAERTGGITPRIARRIVVDVFPSAADAPEISKDLHGFDPDVPFSIQVAERIKNMAGGSEINNQVAPVMPAANPADVTKNEDDLVARLFKIGDRARGELARMVPEMAGALATHDDGDGE